VKHPILPRAARALLVLLGVAALAAAGFTPAFRAGAARATTVGMHAAVRDHPLVLAHYYIWFTPSSWNRAKTDLPAEGRYSSDDAAVMRQHIRAAKAAGINGFIVSWKSTPVLDQRLHTLVEVARSEGFRLALTYQGLDFDRNALPPKRIAADLRAFSTEYATDPVFDVLGKPFVVLTGTEKLDTAQLAEITTPLRPELLILASEKSVNGYERVASLVDGNLYYWSSVNPDTMPSHSSKLQAMGQAVRARGGIWIAPAAPGFDARLVGGESVVDRKNGATFRKEWRAAVASQPTATGIISWNEFSENTYIEPSRRYSTQYLRILSDLTGAGSADLTDFDSDAPAGRGSPWRATATLTGLGGLIVVSGVVIVRRQRRYRSPTGTQ
jgi:hypothetical protein